MKVLSEDNRYMTTSILLSQYYDIEYKGGNSGLRKYTKDKSSENLVILLDVVPDNYSTVGLYKAMRSDIVRNGLIGKVFLYPIVCTEYFVLLALWDMGVCDYKESFRSFEKQCKLLLNNSNMRFHNVNMDNSDIKNLYQDISYYLHDDTISTYEKAMKIAAQYPALIFSPDLKISDKSEGVNLLTECCKEYQTEADHWIKSDISKNLGDQWGEKYS